MSQDRIVNKKQNILIVVAFTLLVVIICIASFGMTAIFRNAANSNIEENAKDILVQSTKNIADYTDTRLTSSLNTLSGYAISFAHSDEMTKEEIEDCIHHCLEDGKFVELAYVNHNGTVFGETSVNARMYATRSLSGHSEMLTSESLYTVPVFCENKVVGALVGKTDPNNYNATTFNMYGVTQNSFMVDSDGVVINASQTPVVRLGVGDNIPVLLSNENDTNFLTTVLSQKDESVCEIVKYGQVRYFLTACSMNTNNWTMVSFVPCSAVTQSSENVIMPLNYLVAFLTAVFFILALYLIYYTYRIRKQAKEIVDENNKINYIDDLTGYASWKSFMENYDKKLLDTSLNLAFISLDIDKFKTVNDTLGYEGGNKVLKQVAGIIARDIGSNDLFARNGADNFNILAEYEKQEDVVELVNHIISDIEYQITDIKISVSIGIFLITDRNMKIRAVHDRANIARASIKSSNGSYYCFFDNSMLNDLREEKNIENSMEEALEKKEFLVYLQPKYALNDNSNEVIGAEALVRWCHNGEIISPGKFIPVFEKNGFITKLDFYMFKEVCKLQKHWKSKGYAPKVISVNMSRLHFTDPYFVDTLKKYCEEYDIDTKYFEIEITESAAYENISILMDVFSKIKAAGFHVSIDDFGTGYSSLNMLKDLPVDVLKIDRSFLTENAKEEENASKIIGCVVSLASSLDISTICEGIETKQQASLLSKLGCDMAQGFYFARPMPVKDYEKLVFGIED